MKGRTGSRSLKYACLRSFCNRSAIFSGIFVGLFLLATGPLLAEPARLLVLGDSLSAGYGLPIEQSFPAQLERRLRAQGHDVTVLNAGVSGDTSAGGLARLGWALADKPDFVLIELGANDGLRGLDPAALRANLDTIIERLQRAGKGVMLAGMLAPPNMGPSYETGFNRVYPALAEKHKIVFYPFFLEGVAANPALNQPDGLHPTAGGIAIIVDRITPYVVRLLGSKNGK
jgi:acyl-CoA thioesterase I